MAIVPLDHDCGWRRSTGGFELVLTNVGDTPLQFTSGIARGTIVDADGNVVATSANVAVAAIGITVDLAPGGVDPRTGRGQHCKL